MKSAGLVALFLTSLMFTVVPAHAATPPDEESPPTRVGGRIPVDPAGEEALAGVYVVTLVDGEAGAVVAADAGVTPRFAYGTAIDGFTASLSQRQLKTLQRDPRVEAIESDQRISLEAIQQSSDMNIQTIGINEPYGLDRIDQRDLPLSGEYGYVTTGRLVSVYVIDSGIMTGLDDFGDRADNVFDVFGGDGQDCNGHGTHVAGTIGGQKYGVAKEARLRGVRAVDCSGSGTLSGLLKAVDWIQQNASRPAVANFSLSTSRSRVLNKAINRLADSGVAVAVAAGNGGADACQQSPASAKKVLAVAAVDMEDRRAYFSNTGPCVDIYAPGGNITSLSLTGQPMTSSGTSMAAPHVAGVMARLKSQGDVRSAVLHDRVRAIASRDVVKDNVGGTPNSMLHIPPK